MLTKENARFLLSLAPDHPTFLAQAKKEGLTPDAFRAQLAEYVRDPVPSSPVVLPPRSSTPPLHIPVGQPPKRHFNWYGALIVLVAIQIVLSLLSQFSHLRYYMSAGRIQFSQYPLFTLLSLLGPVVILGLDIYGFIKLKIHDAIAHRYILYRAVATTAYTVLYVLLTPNYVGIAYSIITVGIYLLLSVPVYRYVKSCVSLPEPPNTSESALEITFQAFGRKTTPKALLHRSTVWLVVVLVLAALLPSKGVWANIFASLESPMALISLIPYRLQDPDSADYEPFNEGSLLMMPIHIERASRAALTEKELYEIDGSYTWQAVYSFIPWLSLVFLFRMIERIHKYTHSVNEQITKGIAQFSIQQDIPRFSDAPFVFGCAVCYLLIPLAIEFSSLLISWFNLPLFSIVAAALAAAVANKARTASEQYELACEHAIRTLANVSITSVPACSIPPAPIPTSTAGTATPPTLAPASPAKRVVVHPKKKSTSASYTDRNKSE